MRMAKSIRLIKLLNWGSIKKRILRGAIMNNSTVKRFDIMIKLRGDNIYDLYFNDRWVASRGHYENILDEAKKLIEADLLNG